MKSSFIISFLTVLFFNVILPFLLITAKRLNSKISSLIFIQVGNISFT